LRRHRTILRTNSQRNPEQGIIIVLVAVVMLFVVGAMAALSIDVATIYTARSEAQLAADGAALAAARVLANSGATSDPNSLTDSLMANAWTLAQAVALQVAEQNQVGGAKLTAAQITLTGPGGTSTNPTVKVSVQVTNLPTFFARILGTRFLTVAASATAEAYNPSGANAQTGTTIPVAPLCVKPWLLPNMDPRDLTGATNIFSATSGAITAPSGLLGWTTPPAPPPNPPTRLKLVCNPPNTTNNGDCSTLPAPKVWQYYPGDPASFPPPTQALPACVPALTTAYEQSVAGCIQTPIACNSNVNIDTSNYGNARNLETRNAVNCLTHAAANRGDQVDVADAPSPPFQFQAGDDNPIPGLAGSDVMVSDSLVTVPVFDSSGGATPTVTIVGFVQLFLSPQGTAVPFSGHMRTTVINLAGCGSGSVGQQPILGNGASPVAVRLISQ